LGGRDHVGFIGRRGCGALVAGLGEWRVELRDE
jgi:hypothetical protein